MYNLRLHDMEDLESKFLISIPDNKTKKLYRKYSALRLENFENSCLFFKYQNGKGCKQVVGIHQFGKIRQIVPKFLYLPNFGEYKRP